MVRIEITVLIAVSLKVSFLSMANCIIYIFSGNGNFFFLQRTVFSQKITINKS